MIISDLSDITVNIQRRILVEPAHKSALYNLLTFCETARTSDEIEHEMRSWPAMKASVQPPRILLAWLVQVGGIARTEAEKQEPRWLTTPAGREAVGHKDPEALLRDLLARESDYRAVCLRILQACLQPRATAWLESLLRDDPLPVHSQIYASYFIAALEQAGGLAWDDGWRTTRSGIKIINEENNHTHGKQKLFIPDSAP